MFAVSLTKGLESVDDASPLAVMAAVREELAELRDSNLLGPMELEWAIEQLVSAGVGLPEMLSVIFDFAELEWLAQMSARLSGSEAEPPSELVMELARRLGLEPNTGHLLQQAPAPPPLSDKVPSSNLHRRRDATVVGCEGLRQRRLRGWDS